MFCEVEREKHRPRTKKLSKQSVTFVCKDKRSEGRLMGV